MPSGEKTGCVSQAGFSVSGSGGADPSTGTRYRSKSVDHASPLPPSREAKMSCFPSGVKVISSAPPNGFDGTSPVRPAVTSTASPPATERTNSRDLRPSFQWSQ